VTSAHDDAHKRLADSRKELQAASLPRAPIGAPRVPGIARHGLAWQAAALAHEVELNEARLRHSTALASLEEKLALAQAEARRCRSLAGIVRHRRRLPVLSVGSA
jgi:hypothetical protein